MKNDYKQKRVMPESDLELNYYFTNPQWGDDSVNIELQQALTKINSRFVQAGDVYYNQKGDALISDGNVVATETKNYWANLSFLTRDIRLANYGSAEYLYCTYFYELGGSMLNEGMISSASICIQMAAIQGEMSQGKGGFLRRIQNTLIKEERNNPLDTKKNTVLQGNKQGGN